VLLRSTSRLELESTGELTPPLRLRFQDCNSHYRPPTNLFRSYHHVSGSSSNSASRATTMDFLTFHRVLPSNSCCMLLSRKSPVKNPYLVLRQKEQDIARVRKEIAALLTVIPLLWDMAGLSDEFGTHLDTSSESLAACAGNGMDDAVTYHPFVETLLRMK
jgi:hypothetical protein